jgi:hypothetical protein
MRDSSEIYTFRKAKCSSYPVAHQAWISHIGDFNSLQETLPTIPLGSLTRLGLSSNEPGQRNRMARTLESWRAMANLATDRLRWYCRSDAHKEPTMIREEVFHVTDLGSQLKPLIANWMSNAEIRKCAYCGEVAAVK